MSTSTPLNTKVQRLASLIESDVQRRGLATGDAYLTAAQASQDFGVDPFTATRAMGLLAKRGVLIRKRGVGTFIGERNGTPCVTAIRHVQVLHGAISTDFQWAFPIGVILQELHDKLPDYQVRSTILPAENSLALARKMIHNHMNDAALSGILLLRCDRDIQQLVRDLHIPAVVFGSAYLAAEELCTIDIDQFTAGLLVTQRLLRSGHQRIMVLMRENWLPGDNKFLEGINQGMSEADATCDALITRSTSEEVPAVEREIHRILALENRPTGLICRTGRFAEIALSTLNAKGLHAPTDLDIMFSSYDTTIASKLGMPCCCPEFSCQSQAALMAQALRTQLAQGFSGKSEHGKLPIRLFEPKTHL